MKPVIEFTCTNGDAAPLYACGRCRMLGTVIDRANSKEAAESCCLCELCKEKPKQRYYVYCTECGAKVRQQRARDEQDRLETLPQVEYDGGMVYHADKFYTDLADVFDDLDEVELATVIIHPCTEGKASVPNLVEYVEDYIAEQFDEDYGPFLSNQDQEALIAIENKITAPPLWMPRLDVRLKRTWLHSPEGTATCVSSR